jgi:polysaccharidase protein
MPNRQACQFAFVITAFACVMALPAAAVAQARYHLDASSGSDSNDGLQPDRAWQSLDRLNQARLEPGDIVLFRRGGTWKGQVTLKASGRAGQPIMFSAYGTGQDPVLSDGRNGIDGNGQSHVVVRNLQIRNTTGAAIQSAGSTGWHIDRVVIDRSGLGHDGKNKEFAGIQFWKSRDLTIENSVLTNVRGDGIWGWEIRGLKILKTRIEACQGVAADNVHLYMPRDFEIRGNTFSMEGKTDSGKGNLHSQAGTDGVVEDNVFRGGNFGVGMTDNNLVVRNNRFFNHNKEKWSAAIIVSEVYDVKNNVFAGNSVVNANMGIYIFSMRDKYSRESFRIRDNVFEAIRRAAVVIETPISGEFTDNILRNSPGAAVITRSGWLIRGQRWDERANVAIGAGADRLPLSGQPR